MFDDMNDLWIKSFEEKFRSLCVVKSDAASLRLAASDHTEDFQCMPQVVAEHNNTGVVSQILKWANEHGVPVTPAGALTGLSG